MNRLVVKSRVSEDGTLRLVLPVGVAAADQEVQVTVEPLTASATLTVEQWQAGILATAGGWQGDFARPEAGPLEEREPLS